MEFHCSIVKLWYRIPNCQSPDSPCCPGIDPNFNKNKPWLGAHSKEHPLIRLIASAHGGTIGDDIWKQLYHLHLIENRPSVCGKHSLPRKVLVEQWLNNLTSWLTDLSEAMSMIRWKGMGANQLIGKNIRCFTELWMLFLHPMWPPSAWFQPWTVVTKWFWRYQIHWHVSIPASHHFKKFVCIWSNLTSWSVKSSLKHFSHYLSCFLSLWSPGFCTSYNKSIASSQWLPFSQAVMVAL